MCGLGALEVYLPSSGRSPGQILRKATPFSEILYCKLKINTVKWKRLQCTGIWDNLLWTSRLLRVCEKIWCAPLLFRNIAGPLNVDLKGGAFLKCSPLLVLKPVFKGTQPWPPGNFRCHYMYTYGRNLTWHMTDHRSDLNGHIWTKSIDM